MAAINNYKCPCCGAPLSFDGNTQNLQCQSCGSEFETETLRQLMENEQSASQSKFDWEHYEPRSYKDDGGIDLSSYSCPSCGADIIGDNNLGATICPYCGNATIVQGNFEGALRPDYLIPFKIDKRRAMQCFENACSNAPFLPDEFRDKRVIEKMAGVYVPFWAFDCDCNANITYNAHRVATWSDSNYDYVKTDYYKLIRAGKVGFANIPVDASTKTENQYMEGVEPFNYADAVDFNTAYLAGYLADRYDVSAEDSIDRANERVKHSTEGAFRSTTAGYMGVRAEQSSVSFSNGKIRYSLLPVWMLNIRYMDKMYKYVINGQTGKVAGEYPVSRSKRNKFFALVCGITMAIGVAIAYAYTNFM